MRITVISSKERCGIQTYSKALAAGFRANGHRVDEIGVGWWDSRALLRESGRIARDSELVVIEHEFAIFRNAALALAMARMRLAGKRILLSMHELEPDKFINYHKIVGALHERLRGPALGGLARIVWLALVVAQRMLRYRLTLWLLGALPARIVVHSERALAHAGLLTGDASKVAQIPHFIEPLDGVAEPSGDGEEERRAARRRLGLPQDRFIFISPGFIYRRKRLIEVIAATPADALIVLSGTESKFDGAYLDEIRAYVAARGLRNVVINTDYDTLSDHVMAADVVVLFYKLTFQSGIASHAIWAEKPCVFSDDPAFDLYEGAGLRAADERELAHAMADIRRPEVAQPLRARARVIKRELSPQAMALRYLAGLGTDEGARAERVARGAGMR